MRLGRIPDYGQRLVNADGTITEEARLFLESLQGIIDSSIDFIYCVSTFDNLLAITDEIKNPDALAESPLVMVKGQGLATYRKDTQQWVLASDYTTLVA